MTSPPHEGILIPRRIVAQLRTAAAAAGAGRRPRAAAHRRPQRDLADEPGERERRPPPPRPPPGTPSRRRRRSRRGRRSAPARQRRDRRRVHVPDCASAPAPAGSRSASSTARRLVKTAPSTAVPSEPPIERNSVAPRGRDPEVLVGRVVLDGEDQHLHRPCPRPKPSIAMNAAAVGHAGARAHARRAAASRPPSAPCRGWGRAGSGRCDAIIRPDRTDDTMTPPISGSSCRPEAVGLSPRTTCWKSGRNVTAPNSAKPMIEADRARDPERRAAPQARRQDRLGGAALHQEERDEGDDARRRRAPRSPATTRRTWCRRASSRARPRSGRWPAGRCPPRRARAGRPSATARERARRAPAKARNPSGRLM